jgi:hypothetical protein
VLVTAPKYFSLNIAKEHAGTHLFRSAIDNDECIQFGYEITPYMMASNEPACESLARLYLRLNLGITTLLIHINFYDTAIHFNRLNVLTICLKNNDGCKLQKLISIYEQPSLDLYVENQNLVAISLH